MKRTYILIFSILTLFAFNSCENYVSDIQQPVQVADDALITATDIPFLTKGIQFRFAQCATNLLMCAEGLSDTYIFDTDVPNATYPQFRDIDAGNITRDNNSVRGFYNNLNEFRFYADDMVKKVNNYTVTDAVKKSALYTGYFYGGLARYYLATYFALSQGGVGGGTIDKSPYIPADQMYAQAIEKFNLAAQWAPDDASKRIINTHLARIYLFQGNYAAAATAASAGMQAGDASFNALYDLVNANQFYVQAGRFRAQWVFNFRFKDYIDADPTEAGRILLEPVKGNSGKIFYRQAKMLNETAPIVCATWQENTLMLAELALRGQATGDPLTLINQVRASHNVTQLVGGVADLDLIYSERDKELNLMGLRLVDERRFNKFHLTADKWQFFPITIDELNYNSNLPANP